MGLIICDKHGQQGIAINIQDEICRSILANEPLCNEDLKIIKVVFFDENRPLMEMNHIVTTSLKEKLALEDLYEIREESEEETLIRPFTSKMGIVCGQCLNEYEHKKAIADTLKAYRDISTY